MCDKGYRREKAWKLNLSTCMEYPYDYSRFPFFQKQIYTLWASLNIVTIELIFDLIGTFKGEEWRMVRDEGINRAAIYRCASVK